MVRPASIHTIQDKQQLGDIIQTFNTNNSDIIQTFNVNLKLNSSSKLIISLLLENRNLEIMFQDETMLFNSIFFLSIHLINLSRARNEFVPINSSNKSIQRINIHTLHPTNTTIYQYHVCT